MGISSEDYRPYEKEYGGRAYRNYRMIFNNFRFLLRSWPSRIVIAISYFFVFLIVIQMLLGDMPLQSSSEDQFLGMKDIRFEITPGEQEAVLQEVGLGETAVFTYNVRHVGRDTSDMDVRAVGPNSYWGVEAWIENNHTVLEKGRSTTITVMVTAPSDPDEYLYLPTMGDISDGSDGSDEQYGRGPAAPSGGMEYKATSGSGEMSSELMQEDHDAAMVGMDSTDMFNVTRRVTVFAMAGEIGFGDIGWIMNDPRTSSITTYVTLPDNDLARILNDTTASPADFGIYAEGSDNHHVTHSLGANKYTSYNIFIENHSPRTLVLLIDYRLSFSNDEKWNITAQGLASDVMSMFMDAMADEGMDGGGGGPGDGKDGMDGGGGSGDGSLPWDNLGAIMVMPYQTTNFTLTVQASHDAIKKPFNINIMATNIMGEGMERTNSTVVTARVDSVIVTDTTSRAFYDILWGKGFHYERYLWMIFLFSIAGAGIIANDVRYNSISLYFSRPLLKEEYIAGKGAALFMFMCLTTAVPAFLLYFVGSIMSSVSIWFFLTHLWVLGSMMLSIFITLTIFTTLCLAISSLTKKWMYAGAIIFTSFIFPSILSNILLDIFGSDYIKLIDPRNNLKGVFLFLFDLHYSVKGFGYEWYYPAGVLAAIFIGSLAILIVRLKATELTQ